MDAAVMHDPPVPGMKLEAGDDQIAIGRHPQREGSVDVAPVSRNFEWFRHCQDEIGLAKLPPVVKRRKRGKLARFTRFAAGQRPAFERLFLERA